MEKKILLIGTGGTIASEMSGDGLAPELNATELLRFVPGTTISNFRTNICLY